MEELLPASPRAAPSPRMVAALYVETGGCYFNLPGVDPWDRERDARQYAGPHPVVAHPPCERWSSLNNLVLARYPDQSERFAHGKAIVYFTEQRL